MVAEESEKRKEESEWGPFSADYARELRERLVSWCKTPELTTEVGPVDVCEVILPAIDAMLNRGGS